MSRARYTDEDKARLLGEFDACGRSAAAFCRDRGLSYVSAQWMGVGRISPPEHGEHTQVCMLLTISSASGRASLGGGGLPAGRQQRTEIVPVGHGRQAFEHVGQPDLGVVAVTFAAIANPTARTRGNSGFPTRRHSDSLREPRNGYQRSSRRDPESAPCDRSPGRRFRPSGRRSTRRKGPNPAKRTDSTKVPGFVQQSNSQRIE
jgi:hypothetical protein